MEGEAVNKGLPRSGSGLIRASPTSCPFLAQRDPSLRPSAAELLRHPFVAPPADGRRIPALVHDPEWAGVSSAGGGGVDDRHVFLYGGREQPQHQGDSGPEHASSSYALPSPSLSAHQRHRQRPQHRVISEDGAKEREPVQGAEGAAGAVGDVEVDGLAALEPGEAAAIGNQKGMATTAAGGVLSPSAQKMVTTAVVPPTATAVEVTVESGEVQRQAEEEEAASLRIQPPLFKVRRGRGARLRSD